MVLSLPWLASVTLRKAFCLPKYERLHLTTFIKCLNMFA